MTSKSDGLEEELRQKLKLRRELQGEIAKAEAGGQLSLLIPSALGPKLSYHSDETTYSRCCTANSSSGDKTSVLRP